MNVDQVTCTACATLQDADAVIRYFEDNVEHYVCVNFTQCSERVKVAVNGGDVASTDAIAHERVRTAIGRMRALLGDLEFVDAALTRSIMERADREAAEQAARVRTGEDSGDLAQMVGQLANALGRLQQEVRGMKPESSGPAGFKPEGSRTVPLDWASVR